MPTSHRNKFIAGPLANYSPTKPTYLHPDASGGGKKPPSKPPTKTGGLPDKPDDDHDWRRSNKELNKQLMSPYNPGVLRPKTRPDKTSDIEFDDVWGKDKPKKNVYTTDTKKTEYTKKTRIRDLDRDRKNIELPKRNMNADDWKKETGNGY